MRKIQRLTNNKFLNIKEVYDEENHVHGYQFAERRGVDSVAFICYDKNTKQYLLNNEYTPPENEFLIRAFGGSFDKNKSALEIVIDEVREEAGFEVNEDAVFPLGKVFVSTQMNQYCHLFLVFIDKNKQLPRKPENKIEEMAELVWLTKDKILDLTDWKAITIVSKAEVQIIMLWGL